MEKEQQLSLTFQNLKLYKLKLIEEQYILIFGYPFSISNRLNLYLQN